MQADFRRTMDLLVIQETVDAEYNPDLLSQYQDDIAEIAKAFPNSAWEIFRNGTDAEFAALVNVIADLGEEFQSDSANREIMSLAKKRGTPEVLEQTQAGFGVLFDKYWNETPPVQKARTFKQVYTG